MGGADATCGECGGGGGADGGGGTPLHSGQLPTVAEVRSPEVLHSLSHPVMVRELQLLKAAFGTDVNSDFVFFSEPFCSRL